MKTYDSKSFMDHSFEVFLVNGEGEWLEGCAFTFTNNFD